MALNSLESEMFGKFKNEFFTNQVVEIGQTSSPELDGQYVQILGKAVEDTSDVYIVLLSKPVDGKIATTITEVCLTAVIGAMGEPVMAHPVWCMRIN